MTPEQQAAESAKYTSLQYAFVPHEDGRLSLFISYGAHRTYNGTFSAEEIIARIRSDFEHRARNAEAHRRLHTPREPDLSGLDFSNINIEL